MVGKYGIRNAVLDKSDTASTVYEKEDSTELEVRFC
jgi:hypothetical protein